MENEGVVRTLIENYERIPNKTDLVFILLNVSDVGSNIAPLIGIPKKLFVQTVSKLRNRGILIKYEKGVRKYKLVGSNYYPLNVRVLERVSEREYRGRVYGIIDVVVRTSRVLKPGAEYTLNVKIRVENGKIILEDGV